ncbi:hypothetical protein ASG77_12055 [Arthrobacter sp. Soil762]|nr:hypothetical protein ASG77_12055 [Arthrobacter sp. Soil762]
MNCRNGLRARRSLISTGLGASLVAALPGAAVAVSTADDAGLRTDPFLLGIASGGPWPDGFVIWTRLALDPLDGDGLPARPHARIETAHSVHVELKE